MQDKLTIFFFMFCISGVSFKSRNFTTHSAAPSKTLIGKVVLLNWCNSCYLQECAFQKNATNWHFSNSFFPWIVNFLLELGKKKKGTANQIKKQRKESWRQFSSWPHLVESNHNYSWIFPFSLFATVMQKEISEVSSDNRKLKLRKS